MPKCRHVLLLKPKPESTPADIEACRSAILGLVGRIPGLLDCHWGENFAPAARRDGCSVGFTMDFEDRASLEAYGPHPDHKAAGALVVKTFEKILVLDLEL